MDSDEARRHRLFRKLEQVLGPEEAATVMEHLHPRRWDELATKADIEGLRKATQSDIEGLRKATQSDIEGLRKATQSDIEGLRKATQSDIEGLRHWTAERFAAERDWTAMRFAAERDWAAERFARLDAHVDRSTQEVLATVRGEMNRLITTQTRTIVFSLVAALTANTGIVLTVFRFG